MNQSQRVLAGCNNMFRILDCIGYLMNPLKRFMRYCWVSILSIIALSACNEPNEDLVISMKDGNKIVLNSESIVCYDNEFDFLHSTNFLFNCKYSFISKNLGPYLLDNDYTIIGYDDRFTGSWEKAIFGDWITKYGLEPNKIYYCATIKYVLYLPKPSIGYEYIPILPLNQMGYTSWTLNKSFDIEYNTEYPKYVFYTGFRYIGYDENHQGVYIELPTLNNNIIWNFSVKQ